MRALAALVAAALAAPAAAEGAGQAALEPMLERAARIVITECRPDDATLVYDASKDHVVAGNVLAQRFDARCPDSDQTITIICFSPMVGRHTPECMRR